MKDLGPLIRLHKLQVDERRRELSELQDAEARLLARRAVLDGELETERRATEGAELFVAASFPAFLKSIRQRMDALDGQIAGMRVEIAAAEERVTEAFQELKRYETAQEERQKAKLLERKRRETQNFDEVASTRFQRAKVE